jgi:hypothetical protein
MLITFWQIPHQEKEDKSVNSWGFILTWLEGHPVVQSSCLVSLGLSFLLT